VENYCHLLCQTWQRRERVGNRDAYTPEHRDEDSATN